MAAARVSLLDVNVLVALFFPDHIHHDLAHDWFADHRREGWATCPLTEHGLIRVACQQPSDDGLVRPADVIAHLERFRRDKLHRTWTDSVSLTDSALFARQFIGGHRQITDVYLLGLAKKMGGRLATFDRAIPVKAVRGGTAELLHVIEP
ncbi:MAG: PIN domain-containing protein [Cyanobacteria bacterium]|nr:PIN domain-containing protein [Cyanobacteriota bacterium]